MVTEGRERTSWADANETGAGGGVAVRAGGVGLDLNLVIASVIAFDKGFKILKRSERRRFFVFVRMIV